jgi:hypothetical protein
MFTVWGDPRNKSHPVKAHKPSLGSDPQVAVGGLGDGLRSSVEETVGNPPGGVGILGGLPPGSSAEDEIVKRAREITKPTNGRKQSGSGAVERWSARQRNLSLREFKSLSPRYCLYPDSVGQD